ncbi:hypothetical protein H9Q69_013325 [Fusarium xylarioides]|nr:hypothetical protein H9Q69_013325 [Fusarium xylarioides]
MSFPQRPSADEDEDPPLELTRRYGLDPPGDSQYAAPSESSIQKRPLDQTDRKGKKRRQEKGKMRVGKGYDNRAGSDESDDGKGEDSGRGYSDGYRFPRRDNAPRGIFACPFQKHDPVRYMECLKVQPSRVSDIIKHISRRHVLKESIIRKEDIQIPETVVRPEDQSTYCPRCRREFRGRDAAYELGHHRNGELCQFSEIQQTGVLLNREMETLRWLMRRGSSEAEKWNTIWMMCFPQSVIPSPYLEILVSQPEAEPIQQERLGSTAAELRSLASINTEEARYSEYFASSFSPFGVWENTLPILLSGANDKESTYEKSDHNPSVVAESVVNPYLIDRWNSLVKGAILDIDYDAIHNILKSSFDQVAIGDYEWLLELRDLGLSMDEIADELLERAQHAPWIYSKINVPDVETKRHGFHLPQCLHSRKEDEAMSTGSSQPIQGRMSPYSDAETSIRDTIGYLCGIGGVSPMPDGSPNLQFGSVLFENARSTAIVALLDREPDQVVPDIWQHLDKAIGTLQGVGGCCDSFTFLARRESLVELGRIDADRTPTLEPLLSRKYSETSLEDLDPQLLSSLAAQFFSLAFALYAQGHCEPFRPFFLDTPLKRILLIGNQIWGPSFNGPCILATPVDLSCFGEMIKRRVFAFQYFDGFERSRVFSDCDNKFDLKACPEDLLDTWGPGSFIIPKDDSENLHAISIGGGLITPAPTQTEKDHLPVLHWSSLSEGHINFTSAFSRHEKMVIGSRVSMNEACRMTPQDQFQMAMPWMEELGTFPSYWEVSERQLGLGLQGGQSAVGIVNFAQTWVKRLGQTKKSNILAKKSLSMADLEGPFAVQVSFCTGIARRVRLRELLADILPAYVADLATQPYHWGRLQDCDILEILRHEDFREHYQKLDHELQAEFETLAISVLFLLQDTGVDRKSENFIVGCIPQGLAVHCFKIPLEKESFWARILADSEDIATFAYMATRCFEIDLLKC